MAAGFRWLGIDTDALPRDLLARGVLGSLDVPVHAAYGEETELAWMRETAEWVARVTGGPLDVLPGNHMGFYSHAAAFAEALRPILASMT